jgi:cullin-associated NEDD8-dissociated protein 1
VYVLPWTALQSGAVDTADLLALLAAYGRGCAALVQPADVATVQRGETLGAGTTYMIPMSDPLELLTVVKSSNVSEWPVPCARSYDGNGWEVVQPRAGRPDGLVHVVSCSPGSSSCLITIPSDNDHVYSLGSRTLSSSRHEASDRAAAALLMQATFGPTAADMARLSTFASEEEWVLDQIDQPATLHREYYRRRANPRLNVVSEVGRPRGACEPNSRWNRIAIRQDDLAQNISFSAVALPGGGEVIAMYVGGVLRTEVDVDELRPFGLAGPVDSPDATQNCHWCQNGEVTLDTTYVICRIDEWPMGLVAIGESCDGTIWPGAQPRTEVYNVLMKFNDLSYPDSDVLGLPIEVLELGPGDAELQMLAENIYNTGVLILGDLNVDCPFSIGAQLQPATTVKYEGEYYRYDPRIVLLDNTLESPADPSSISLDGQTRSCPLREMSAPKTFLNEDTCVVSRGCQPDAYTSNQFELNSTTLRQFFLQGNNFVYAIDNLPLDTGKDPCHQRVRWRALGPCAGRATADMSDDTRTVLATAIRSSTDTNRFVKDVELPYEDRSSCSDAVGAVVDVDGECWEHTHNDQLSVYDFTLWAQSHNGNNEVSGFFPVKSVAYDRDDAILHFPPWHGLSRWDQNANNPWTSIKASIGRLGDSVAFADLPVRIQSAGFAEAVGVTISPARGVAGIEMCGSPGETTNDPTLGHQYYFGKERWGNTAIYTQQEMLATGRSNSPRAQTVHTSVMVYGPDQLRQRVAWALSEILILADFSSAVLRDHAEVSSTSSQ